LLLFSTFFSEGPHHPVGSYFEIIFLIIPYSTHADAAPLLLKLNAMAKMCLLIVSCQLKGAIKTSENIGAKPEK